MAGIENILAHKFEPGKSGNPKGRPKGKLDSKTIIRKWMEAKETIKHPITGRMKFLSQLDIIVLRQLAKARQGDTKAFQALMDRMEGKPTQPISGADDKPPVSLMPVMRLSDGTIVPL